MKPIPFGSALALFAFAPLLCAQQAEPEAGLVALHQALLDAQTDAVVLNVAAHPDDESSRTDTVLRRKYGMRVVTAYTTYGDGGQNAIGREIGPDLAYLRVRETLRAAAMSGVEVQWLGMPDFGFSKTLEETRAKWGDDKLLAAMRKVVDEVDPDFVISNHTIGQGHGHHRATFWAIDTVLKERAAAKRYVPALLVRSKIEDAQWIVDPAELEPARGETYARLAHRAWTQHVTQGPWGAHNPLQVGRDWWKVVNPESIAPRAEGGKALEMPWCWVRPGKPTDDLRAGAGRLPRDEMLVAARTALNRQDSSVRFRQGWTDEEPKAVREQIRDSRLAKDYVDELQRILLDAANVRAEIWLDRDEFAVGGDGKANIVVHGAEKLTKLEVRCGDRIGTAVTAPIRAMVFDGLPVSPAGVVPPSAEPANTPPPAAAGTTPAAAGTTPAAAATAPSSPGPAGRFAVTFPIEPPTGGPEPRFVTVQLSFELDGQPFTIHQRLPYTPVARIELEWDREVVMVPKGQTVERVLSVTLNNHLELETTAPIRLGLPPGVQAVPMPARLTLSQEHTQARVLIRATIHADELTADASIEVGFGDVASRIRVLPVDVSVPPGLKVALVRGPDDSTERALADLGVQFTSIDRDALAMAKLEEFSTVLLDIRAYHHRPELAEVRDRLLQFVRGGGRVVAMYHKPGEWNERKGHPQLAPFPLVVGEGRVTEEEAAVTLLHVDHRLLRHPHMIVPADFDGWVQERGLNFPKTWDAAWTPLLAMKDKVEEKLLEGSLLHTQYGRGDFVYCSLALYRQLRTGNAGAARILVNLLAR